MRREIEKGDWVEVDWGSSIDLGYVIEVWEDEGVVYEKVLREGGRLLWTRVTTLVCGWPASRDGTPRWWPRTTSPLEEFRRVVVCREPWSTSLLVDERMPLA